MCSRGQDAVRVKRGRGREGKLERTYRTVTVASVVVKIVVESVVVTTAVG